MQGVHSITTTRKLLTSTWTADVEIVEKAIGRFTVDRPLTNECQVTLFEVVHDGHLHVSVTHRYPTVEVRGWARPADLPEGFSRNRRFGATQPTRMVRHIHDMVFAERI